MTKQDLLVLIEEFEKETWKYNQSDNLDEDMMIIYNLENEIKQNDSININQFYDLLTAVMGIIRFKYGFESIIISKIPELSKLNEYIRKVPLGVDVNDLINYYHEINNIYSTYLKNITDLDFLENKFNGVEGQEGLYLAFESLKSLITNPEYRELINEDQVNDILLDCIKLLNGTTNIHIIENKYEAIIKIIWTRSLSNSIGIDNNKFKVLFSNISGGDFLEQANNLINRPNQNSCSMITSNFIATYGSDTRRIGFIYPSDSNIIKVSAYDLGSNVFGLGNVNEEKGTKLVTPLVLEKIGIERAKNENEDLYFSSCYNEVLVVSKPCGILIIGLGENDINIDYENAIQLSEQLNIPIYIIDTLNYKNELSEKDRFYLAYHSIMTYLNITSSDLSQTLASDVLAYIYKLANENKEEIAKRYLMLKNNKELSKDKMKELINQVLGDIDIHVESLFKM